VAEAFGWGALGAAALLIGALIAYLLSPGRRVIAVVMALGTGLLIGSVSYELVDDALEHRAVFWVAVMVLVGAAVFTAGDWLLDRGGGGERKDATGAQGGGSPLAIVLGSVLDGIPESFVLGLTVLQGGVLLMWSAVVLVSAVSAAAGYALLDPAGGRTGALVQAFAAGALLAMLADTLLPEAYAVEGVLTGPLVVAGFALSLALSAV
jgi:zinc transporter, ZIP family